jgi:dTDP-4-amino-4,6-dideoxygalactose transaminase
MPDSAKVPARSAPIAFIDLQAQRARIAPRIDAAIARVLAHGAFIMGPEVAELERRLAQHSDTKHVVSCSSGTDALLMCLLAQDIGRGDAVFVPSFSFTATAEVVVLAGATPVFVDVLPDTFNMDAASLERAIAVARQTGLKPTCVIPVDLFGQPTDIAAITRVAEAHKLWVLNDAAQSYGATYRGKRLGPFGGATATSFYPSKPLGCYGDGGAIFTNDDELHHRLIQVRVHGQGRDRNETLRIGLTARFDSIQAAVLLEKLAIFDDECVARQKCAEHYNAGLANVVQIPVVAKDATSVWAQYTVRSNRRDRIVASLNAKQIPTQVFYPKPIHTQTPYKGYPVAGGGLPVTEQLAQDVVCLPLHPYLSAEDQERVIAAVRAAVA